MRKRGLSFLALTLVLASTVSLVPSVKADELVVETDKVYTPDTVSGQAGYWVEFTRKRYAKNQFFIAEPVGRYDATIQEQFALITGLNRALSKAELSAIYSTYAIPLAHSTARDASLHDLDWDSKLTQIKADLRAGTLTAAKANNADVVFTNKLLNAENTAQLIDAIGPAAVDTWLLDAFTANGGGEYVYTASDGAHTLSYTHGINYINPNEFNAAAYNAHKNESIQSVLLNNPADLKKLQGMGNVDALMQAARFRALAAMIDKGINPVGLEIDTWVDTVNGPVHLVESQPSAARLRDLTTWLVASTWTTHSPIVLDLNHDGKIGVTGASTAQKRLHANGFVGQGAVDFDIMAAGKKQHIEWLNGDGDGFLVDDTTGVVTRAAAGNGEITAAVLFGDATGYANGYHKLAYKATKLQLASVLHTDATTNWSALYHKQPVLKGKVLSNLKVWVDANRDAKVQTGEVSTLAALGITEIGSRPVIKRNQHGEYVIQSYYVQQGQRHLTEDVWFAEDPAKQTR